MSNPCLSTTLDSLSLILNATNLVYTYSTNSNPAVISILSNIKDVASKTYGNLDGYTLCDARVFHLIDPITNLEINQTEITIVGDDITFNLMTEGLFTHNILFGLS